MIVRVLQGASWEFYRSLRDVKKGILKAQGVQRDLKWFHRAPGRSEKFQRVSPFFLKNPFLRSF